MKSKELKNKDQKELLHMLSESRAELTKLGFELEANTLKNTGGIKKSKKNIARVLTELNSRK